MTHHITNHRPALSGGIVLTRQAERWAGHVLNVTELKPAYVWRKALSAARFSAEVGASSLAIPSKLYGTRDRQDALREVHDLNLVRGHRLTAKSVAGELEVRFADVVLGEVQRKHVLWLRPLIARGASVHLLAVSGTDSPRKYFGCNVAFAHVTEAISRLEREASGDSLPAQVEVPDVEPVRLWRERGEARTNIEHTCRHSPTGIEWGYVGSGPSDLARSILLHVADEEAAERHAHLFTHTVISRVPQERAVLQPQAVREWLRRQDAE